jgi:hypothetical protein
MCAEQYIYKSLSPWKIYDRVYISEIWEGVKSQVPTPANNTWK